MGSVFSDYQEGAAIFGSVSPPRGGRTKFVLRSRLVLEIRSDRTEAALRATLGSSPACQARLPSFSVLPASPSCSPPLSKPPPPVFLDGGCCAGDRRPPRSPTNCARVPRASSLWPPPPASLRSCPRGRLSSRR